MAELVVHDSDSGSEVGNEVRGVTYHLSVPDLQREIETAFEESFKTHIVEEIRHTALMQQLDQTKMEIFRLSNQRSADINSRSDLALQQQISKQRAEYETKIAALEEQLAASQEQHRQARCSCCQELERQLAAALEKLHQLESNWAAREEELATLHAIQLKTVAAESEQRIASLRAEYDAASAALSRESDVASRSLLRADRHMRARSTLATPRAVARAK